MKDRLTLPLAIGDKVIAFLNTGIALLVARIFDPKEMKIGKRIFVYWSGVIRRY